MQYQMPGHLLQYQLLYRSSRAHSLSRLPAKPRLMCGVLQGLQPFLFLLLHPAGALESTATAAPLHVMGPPHCSRIGNSDHDLSLDCPRWHISAQTDEIYTRLIRKENPFTTKRLDAFDFGTGPEIDVIIRLRGMRTPITKTMPRPRRGKGIGLNAKPKRNGTPTGPQTSGAKDRPRKPSQQAQGTNTNPVAKVNLPNTWSTQQSRSAPPKRESWAQRAAAAPVH